MVILNILYAPLVIWHLINAKNSGYLKTQYLEFAFPHHHQKLTFSSDYYIAIGILDGRGNAMLRTFFRSCGCYYVVKIILIIILLIIHGISSLNRHLPAQC